MVIEWTVKAGLQQQPWLQNNHIGLITTEEQWLNHRRGIVSYFYTLDLRVQMHECWRKSMPLNLEEPVFTDVWRKAQGNSSSRLWSCLRWGSALLPSLFGEQPVIPSATLAMAKYNSRNVKRYNSYRRSWRIDCHLLHPPSCQMSVKRKY